MPSLLLIYIYNIVEEEVVPKKEKHVDFFTCFFFYCPLSFFENILCRWLVHSTFLICVASSNFLVPLLSPLPITVVYFILCISMLFLKPSTIISGSCMSNSYWNSLNSCVLLEINFYVQHVHKYNSICFLLLPFFVRFPMMHAWKNNISTHTLQSNSKNEKCKKITISKFW